MCRLFCDTPMPIFNRYERNTLYFRRACTHHLFSFVYTCAREPIFLSNRTKIWNTCYRTNCHLCPSKCCYDFLPSTVILHSPSAKHDVEYAVIIPFKFFGTNLWRRVHQIFDDISCEGPTNPVEGTTYAP